MNSAGCGVFLHRAGIRFKVPHDGKHRNRKPVRIQTGKDPHERSHTLVVSLRRLMAVAGVCAVAVGQGYPYTA